MELAKLLLRYGADANAEDRLGTRPIHVAATRLPHYMIVQLRASGADVNARDGFGATALHRAARSDRFLSRSRLLFLSGADINAQDTERRTPLHVAAGANAADTVEFLLAQGADADAMDAEGNTALHHAACRPSSTHVLKLLLDKGASVNTRNDRNETPLLSAIKRAPWFEVEPQPAGRHATPAVLSGTQGGRSVPQCASARMVVWLLAKHGADVNATDAEGATSLHWAARTGRVDLLKPLLEAGAVLDATDRSGLTPLHAAAGHGHVDAAALLIAGGARCNAQDRQGWTPLYWAVKRNHVRVADLLRKHGGRIPFSG
jgi:ankyrin repeat protein